MIALYALAGIDAVVEVFLTIGIVVGAIFLVGVGAILVGLCVVVGIVVGDAVGSIGRGGRRAPDVPYWSAR